MNVWETLKDVRLLVAEDEPDILELYSIWLKTVGWTGDLVSSTEEIISKVNENMADESAHKYDGIISDINFENTTDAMPITGLTAAVQIRKVRPNVPILFVSAWLGSIIREEVRRVSAEVMAKPITVDEVFEKIGKMIIEYRHKGTGDLFLPQKPGEEIHVPEILANNVKK